MIPIRQDYINLMIRIFAFFPLAYLIRELIYMYQAKAAIFLPAGALSAYLCWLYSGKKEKLLTTFVLFSICSIIYILIPKRITILFLCAIFVAYVYWILKDRIKPLIITFVLFVTMTLIPVDFYISDMKRMPSVKKVVMGLVTPKTLSTENINDNFYGGCVVGIYEPTWMIVW